AWHFLPSQLTAVSPPSLSRLQVPCAAGDISVMAGDGSRCCIFSFSRFQDFPQRSDCSAVLVYVLEKELVQRSTLQDKATMPPASCLQCSGKCLKESLKLFLKINCSIFIFGSWFLHIFLLSFCISKPFFRGRMSTNLQLKPRK
uniref:Uncharacterized protein n=1 Tax=Accipiter nisus TaxID=211598 RepID=A0A8B9NDV3_9AVES